MKENTQFIAEAVVSALNPPDGDILIQEHNGNYIVKVKGQLFAMLSPEAFKAILKRYQALQGAVSDTVH
jgi:hypothetical protein